MKKRLNYRDSGRRLSRSLAIRYRTYFRFRTIRRPGKYNLSMNNKHVFSQVQLLYWLC